MAYVKTLLQDKWNLHRASWIGYMESGQDEDVDSCLKVISEIEYVIDLLSHDETYQKY